MLEKYRVGVGFIPFPGMRVRETLTTVTKEGCEQELGVYMSKEMLLRVVELLVKDEQEGQSKPEATES